jgi:hypothetical protein
MGVRVALVSITGDQEEFADLVGTIGTLFLEHGEERYWPNSNDPVRLARKRVSWKNGTIRVFTRLGNVFTFRALPKEKPS